MNAVGRILLGLRVTYRFIEESMLGALVSLVLSVLIDTS